MITVHFFFFRVLLRRLTVSKCPMSVGFMARTLFCNEERETSWMNEEIPTWDFLSPIYALCHKRCWVEEVKMENGESISSNERHAVCKDGSCSRQFRNGSNPWMARYVYGLFFLVSTLLAWAARDYGRNALMEVKSKIPRETYMSHLFNFKWKSSVINFQHLIPIKRKF